MMAKDRDNGAGSWTGMDSEAKTMMTATSTPHHKQALAMTKRNGSHNDKTMGWDNTNTNNEGQDNNDNHRDQGMKTNDEEEDGDNKGPSNQDDGNRMTRAQHG